MLNEWFVWITYMSLGETQGSNTMYIVEIEERDSGEKEYKAFIKRLLEYESCPLRR